MGAAIQEAIKNGIVKRDELFLQTKFTAVKGQGMKKKWCSVFSMSTSATKINLLSTIISYSSERIFQIRTTSRMIPQVLSRSK